MNLFKRIFNINNLILAFALFTFISGVRLFLSISDGFESLTFHKGIIQNKKISFKYFTSTSSITNEEEKDSVPIFNFTVVGDQIQYTASKYALGLNNLLQEGDSIEFYTKNVDSKLGNFVTNGKGQVWTTVSPNEVYHLISKKYDSPLVDFNESKEDLKYTIWVLPICSMILFGWFFYRRSGKKSPFIIETIR